MFQVSLTLLDGEVYEVAILLLVEVRQQILVQVHLLQELYLKLRHILVLFEHALDSHLAPAKHALKDTSAARALTQQLALVDLDLHVVLGRRMNK